VTKITGVLVRMIGYISTPVTLSLLITINITLSLIYTLFNHRCTRTRIPSLH
jgi:hypothetical protein